MAAIEATVLGIQLFQIPSGESSLPFGFSAARLLMLGGFFAALLLNLILAMLTHRNNRFISWLNTALTTRDGLFWPGSFLLASLLIASLTVLIQEEAFFITSEQAFIRLKPGLIFLSLLCAQGLLLLLGLRSDAFIHAIRTAREVALADPTPPAIQRLDPPQRRHLLWQIGFALLVCGGFTIAFLPYQRIGYYLFHHYPFSGPLLLTASVVLVTVLLLHKPVWLKQAFPVFFVLALLVWAGVNLAQFKNINKNDYPLERQTNNHLMEFLINDEYQYSLADYPVHWTLQNEYPNARLITSDETLKKLMLDKNQLKAFGQAEEVILLEETPHLSRNTMDRLTAHEHQYFFTGDVNQSQDYLLFPQEAGIGQIVYLLLTEDGTAVILPQSLYNTLESEAAP